MCGARGHGIRPAQCEGSRHHASAARDAGQCVYVTQVQACSISCQRVHHVATGLLCTLFHYQRQAVAWMVQREESRRDAGGPHDAGAPSTSQAAAGLPDGGGASASTTESCNPLWKARAFRWARRTSAAGVCSATKVPLGYC